MSDTSIDNAYWRSPSPDTSPQAIWALLREIAESQKETDRRMQETDRRMKETDKKIGDLGNRFGELAEHLVAPNIKEKFKALNLIFEDISRDHIFGDPSGNRYAEIDIILQNVEMLMAIEVKSKPDISDVNKHISRMEILRARMEILNDKRKLRGSIAGAIMTCEVRNYIHKKGFYSIEQSGDTVKINEPEGFTPREW